ncbi:SDR family oxidoreductase [Geomicrobium sp. JCM 19055]
MSSKKSVPLGRLIRPEDISTGIIYLCSDDASMVTGTTLRIDGGRGL